MDYARVEQRFREQLHEFEHLADVADGAARNIRELVVLVSHGVPLHRLAPHLRTLTELMADFAATGHRIEQLFERRDDAQT